METAACADDIDAAKPKNIPNEAGYRRNTHPRLFFTSKENIELEDNRNHSQSKLPERHRREGGKMIPDSAGATPFGIFLLAGRLFTGRPRCGSRAAPQ